MRKLKKYCPFLMICLAIFALGWNQFHKRSFPSERESIPSQNSPAADAEAQPALYGIEVPAEWSEQIDERNRIDAVINIPDTIREEGFRSAYATAVLPSREGLLEFLEDFHLSFVEDYATTTQYMGESGSILNFSNEGFSPFTYFSTEKRDYVSMAYRNGLTADYNRDCYSADAQLPDFSWQECDAWIDGLMSAAGSGGDVWTKRWALDHETMEREAVELHIDGTETRPDYAWSGEDDCYYCEFSQTCSGVPIIPSYMVQYWGDILNMLSHDCIVGRNGFFSFSLYEFYELSYTGEYENLLSFEEILGRYRQVIGLMDRDYDTLLTDITMRVIPVPSGNEQYRMRPVWLFCGYEQWEEGTDDFYVVFLDALTGEQL